jgi:hypothetical protein
LVVKRRSVDNKFQDSLKKTNISEVISFIGVGLFYLQQRVQYQKKESVARKKVRGLRK